MGHIIETCKITPWARIDAGLSRPNLALQEIGIIEPPVKKMPPAFRRFWSRVYALVAYYLGIWPAVYALRRITGKKPLLTVFTFHRIAEEKSSDRHLVTYDKGTPRELFDVQISLVKRFYETVSLEEFTELVTGKRIPQRNSALITFDDADSEFVAQALPVLMKHGCSAVVFAPTDFVDTTKRFWHLRVSNAFHRIGEGTWPGVQALARKFPEDKQDWLENLDYRKRKDLATACWRFNIALDRMPEEEIERFVEDLEQIIGRDYELGIGTMTWPQLKQVRSAGISVESHSASHRKLARLDAESIKQELFDSKSLLERELGVEVTAVCYPAGSYDEQVARIAKDTGYKLGFTTQFGYIDYPLDGIDLLTLTRFDMRGGDRYDVARFLGELPIRRPKKSWPLK